MSTLQPVSLDRVGAIRAEARRRLTEISDHGCEAASARAFEEGRLAVLDALGFREWAIDAAPTDEEIQRCRELDEALRPSGTGQQMRNEPIIRREIYWPVIECLCGAMITMPPTGEPVICGCGRRYDRAMTEPENTEETDVEAAEEPADDVDEAADAAESDD